MNKNGKGSSQQRISLNKGATLGGLKFAKGEALKISGLLELNQFDWTPYLKDLEESAPTATRKPSVEMLIGDLAAQYFSNGGKPDSWRFEYLSQFRKIEDWSQPPNFEELASILEDIDPSSKTRKRAAIAFAKLADAAGIPHEFRQAKGTYSSARPINPRSIPSDQLIAEWWDKITDPRWKNAYALQAIYGLRNYEIWKLDFSDLPIVFCNRGKTDQERFITPLYPEWAEQWLTLPAAKQMGHSESVHRLIYQHWIDFDSYKRTFEILKSNPNRPMPPEENRNRA